jgi:hypothetical protein
MILLGLGLMAPSSPAQAAGVVTEIRPNIRPDSNFVSIAFSEPNASAQTANLVFDSLTVPGVPVRGGTAEEKYMRSSDGFFRIYCIRLATYTECMAMARYTRANRISYENGTVTTRMTGDLGRSVASQLIPNQADGSFVLSLDDPQNMWKLDIKGQGESFELTLAPAGIIH